MVGTGASSLNVVRMLLRQLQRILVLVILAGLASAFLVRYSPGALVDEREMDRRLSSGDVEALRADRAAQLSLGTAVVVYFKNLLHADLGYSESNNAQITGLLKQSAPTTLREIGLGLLGSWFFGLGAGIAVAARGAKRGISRWLVAAASNTASAVLLSLPAALIAYLCLNAGAAAATVLVFVLAPRVFRFAANLLTEAYASPHVDMARARGVPELTILLAHVLLPAAPQLLALFAASLSMAIGAAIPVEAICDTAGLGRLAWQAAMARDLPLLVNLTMLIALATTITAGLAEAAGEAKA